MEKKRKGLELKYKALFHSEDLSKINEINALLYYQLSSIFFSYL